MELKPKEKAEKYLNIHMDIDAISDRNYDVIFKAISIALKAYKERVKGVIDEWLEEVDILTERDRERLKQKLEELK